MITQRVSVNRSHCQNLETRGPIATAGALRIQTHSSQRVVRPLTTLHANLGRSALGLPVPGRPCTSAALGRPRVRQLNRNDAKHSTVMTVIVCGSSHHPIRAPWSELP